MNDNELNRHIRTLLFNCKTRNQCLELLGGYDTYKSMVPLWEDSDYLFHSYKEDPYELDSNWKILHIDKNGFYLELYNSLSDKSTNIYPYKYLYKHSLNSVALHLEIIKIDRGRCTDHFMFTSIHKDTDFVGEMCDKMDSRYIKKSVDLTKEFTESNFYTYFGHFCTQWFE